MKKDLFNFSDFDDNIVENIAEKCPDMDKSEQKALCGKIRKRLNTAENFIGADAVSGVEPAKKPVFRYIFGTAAAAVLAIAVIPVAFKALKNAPDGPEKIQDPPVTVDMSTVPMENEEKSTAAVTTKIGESDETVEVTTHKTTMSEPVSPTNAPEETKATEEKEETTVPTNTTTSATTTKPVTTSTAVSEGNIFDMLANLSYRQETCDGIADYILQAEDGTTYQILTDCNHVWRNGREEADLTPEISEWISKYGSSYKIDKEQLNADIVASGEYGAEGANVVWTLDFEGKLTFSGKGAMKDFVAVDGEEPAPMWLGNRAITEVVIEDGITRIGDDAFTGCSGVKSITIPDSVTSIGDYAFDYCSGLESITIPDSVTDIGVMAFAECRGLKTITIPDSVTTLGSHAFFYCTNLTSVKLSKNLERIEYATFFNCTSLNSVEIKDKVEFIGFSAFSCCSELTDITLPESVATIDNGAFFRCTNLDTITIENPDCVIDDSYSTICNEYDLSTGIVTADCTIIGKISSTAEEYAKKYNIAFEKENQTVEQAFRPTLLYNNSTNCRFHSNSMLFCAGAHYLCPQYRNKIRFFNNLGRSIDRPIFCHYTITKGCSEKRPYLCKPLK